MKIRTHLANVLREALPAKWDVRDTRTVPTNPRHPVVIVRQGNVRRTPGAPRLYRDLDFSVALLVPHTDPAKVEDALEEALDALLDALETVEIPGLTWSEAERATFEESFHGYDTTATITTTKE